jgi:hypothetical protein
MFRDFEKAYDSKSENALVKLEKIKRITVFCKKNSS